MNAFGEEDKGLWADPIHAASFIWNLLYRAGCKRVGKLLIRF